MIIDLNAWHQTQEECNKICIIKSQNASCSDPDKSGMAWFQFDINLPVNMYSFGKCKSCFNITQINTTCMLNKTSIISEPHSTENEEITTSKMIYESHSTQNVEVNTAEMKSKPHSTKNVEITTTEMKSEPDSSNNEEITTSKVIYEPHLTQNVAKNAEEMISKPHSTQYWEITTMNMISRSSGKLISFYCQYISEKKMYHVSVLQMNKRCRSIAIVTGPSKFIYRKVNIFTRKLQGHLHDTNRVKLLKLRNMYY